MPKASTSATVPTRPALRRNQACLSCRKRKLKCDAARPHCGTCVKQWQALISVPAPVGYTHPTEPQCQYDPVEGLPLAADTDPSEKIRLLEEQIVHLKRKLGENGHRNGHGFPSRSESRSPQISLLRPGSSSSGGRMTPDVGGSSSIALPRVSMNMRLQSGIASPESHFRSESGSPEIRSIRSRASTGSFDLFHSGWNTDLPDPPVLNHFIDIFFKCDPCGSRILHQPSFMASMNLHPRDPGFPHSAVLHAICASASRWSSHDVVTLPDGTRRDTFAEYHAGKTRQYIDKTMATGEDIFAVMQACLLLSWYFYQEGRWVEVWIFAGFQTRVAIPLRLNYPGTFTTQGRSSPGAYLAPPKDAKDLESRRRTWWMTIVFDRIASVGGWVHAVDERDIGTEFPLRRVDFENKERMPNNPQDLQTLGAFTTHPPDYTDPFLLLIKAVMLFGKVTDYHVRGNLRGTTPKSQDPYHLPGFAELDKLVAVDFLESLPGEYKSELGPMDGYRAGAVDTDLYMVHIIPHAATITLHNPYLDLADPNRTSTQRCVEAARRILAAYYLLASTSLDITRLHPFVTICWYLAAVVEVQICKYYIESGETEKEQAVWSEINVLRFAMLEYGGRSPIGTRQEKLLQGLMTEIVRLTTQRQPLEVGVPLYPFSHAGLFPKPSQLGSEEGASPGQERQRQQHTAPLPTYEEDSPGTMSGYGAQLGSPGVGSPWSSVRASASGSASAPPESEVEVEMSPNGYM